MYSSYYLPRWNKFFASLRSDISGGDKFDYDSFLSDIMIWEDNWVDLREENIRSEPSGNPIILAKELWDQYGEKMLNH